MVLPPGHQHRNDYSSWSWLWYFPLNILLMEGRVGLINHQVSSSNFKLVIYELIQVCPGEREKTSMPLLSAELPPSFEFRKIRSSPIIPAHRFQII